MAKILIANQKGGVGKSTLADELAFCLERRGFKVVFQNLDNQGGTVHQSGISDGTEDFVVIDTPGSLGRDFSKWCCAVDAIVFPTYASNLDLAPLLRCWDVAQNSRTKAGLFIAVNKYDGHRIVDRKFMHFLENAEMPVIGTIPQATAFVQANSLLESIYDLDPASKASKAIEQIADNLIEYLNQNLEDHIYKED